MSDEPFTSLGGRERFFPTTRWSLVQRAHGVDPERARTALETLAQDYWKPVYAFLRAKWAKSNEDAKDLTQDFFIWLLNSSLLPSADPDRGRFRALLKTSLKYYIMNEHRKSNRQKRGGEHRILSLNFDGDGAVPQVAGGDRTPEEILDAVWKQELLTRAAARLQETLKGEAKEIQFTVFQEYFLSTDGELNYREMAEKHGITTTNVSDYLMAAKRKFRAILVDLVSETVREEDELHEEWNLLFGKGGF